MSLLLSQLLDKHRLVFLISIKTNLAWLLNLWAYDITKILIVQQVNVYESMVCHAYYKIPTRKLQYERKRKLVFIKLVCNLEALIMTKSHLIHNIIVCFASKLAVWTVIN